MRSLANHLHVRAHPVAMDQEGLLPDALEDAALESGRARLYCMPSGQNPTARVMSKKRRHDIAAVVTRLNLMLVEDDAYGFLVEGQEPLCVALPERTFYLTSMSKSLVPGLRIGLSTHASGWIDRVTGAVFATTVMVDTARCRGGVRAGSKTARRRESCNGSGRRVQCTAADGAADAGCSR